MKQTLSVAVVLPVYNGALYLQETLDSIAYQTYRPKQVIIVDDGSSDASRDICLAWAARVTAVEVIYCDSPINLGVCAALRRACDLVTADLIAQIGHDDVWEPCHLEEMVAALDGTSHIAAFGEVSYINDRSEAITARTFNHKLLRKLSRPELFAQLLSGNFICAPASVFRRSAYRKHFWGLNNERLQDYELWLNLLLVGSFVAIPRETVRYRIHGNNLSSAATMQLQSKLELFVTQQKILSSDAVFAFLAEIGSDPAVLLLFLEAMGRNIAAVSTYYEPLLLNFLAFLEIAQERFPGNAQIVHARVNATASAGMLRKALLMSKSDVSIAPSCKENAPILVPANEEANDKLYQFLIETGWFRDGRGIDLVERSEVFFFLARKQDFQDLSKYEQFTRMAQEKRVFLSADQEQVSFGSQCVIPRAQDRIGHHELDRMLRWVEDARRLG